MFPADRRYTKEHEWIRVEGDLGTVGITQFAQGELGDIVYVELPEVGRAFDRGEILGTIESVKAVSEIYAPVAGTIVEVNETLGAAPETVNADPHGRGWLCKLRVADPGAIEGLLDAGAYAKLVAR